MSIRALAQSVLSSALIVLATSLPARAELTWKEKLIHVKVDASVNEVEVKFAFTNTGGTPVDVQQVESSCGCTTANLEQRHYEPGKSGEIIARYTVGNHVGLQRKTILVKAAGQSEPTILTLEADIPEMLRIKPDFVTWEHGDARKPKTILLEATEDVSLEAIEVRCSNPAMKAELATVVKGRKYQITVTPAATDRTVFAKLNIDCRFGKEGARTFRSYATVKPGPSAD